MIYNIAYNIDIIYIILKICNTKYLYIFNKLDFSKINKLLYT